jgi:hypothetical protein
MSDTRVQERAEFWRPVGPEMATPEVARIPRGMCEQCGADYVMGARFCHVCGAEREPQMGRELSVAWPDLAQLRESLNWSVGSTVAFVAGAVFLIAALVTGFRFTTTTVLDWQAVQVWRIQWLLAAIAAFAAGILMKKT